MCILKIKEDYATPINPECDELFETCIHESGHLFALRHYGGDGYIETFENPIQTKLEKDVLGRVICTKQPVIINQTRKTKIIVGLAGHCAELMHFNPETEWLSPELEDFWEYDYDAISNSDRKLTEGAVFDDFDNCAELIKNNYTTILKVANIQYAKHVHSESIKKCSSTAK